MPLADPTPPDSSLALLPALVVLSTIFAGAVASAPAVLESAAVASQPQEGVASVIDGRWAGRFAHELDSRWPARSVAVGVWGVLETVVLGQGRPGVLVGNDGYLFTTEEWTEDRPADHLHPEVQALLQRAQDVLGPDGTILLAVVPDKTRVCAEHLGGHRRPASLAPRYDALRQLASAHSRVHAPDLRPALSCAENPGAFLRTDTHWSPSGAEAVAAVLAEAAGDVRGTSTFERRVGEPVVHTGDLVSFLALGPLEETYGPPPDHFTPFSATLRPTEGLSAASLFGDVELPLVLVGTSFSADPRWSFADALKTAFAMDVVNYADPGEGPMAPMRAWLETGASPPPKVLVWEFPERYLQHSPTPEPHATAEPHANPSD